jgi:hypothetical protein
MYKKLIKFTLGGGGGGEGGYRPNNFSKMIAD